MKAEIKLLPQSSKVEVFNIISNIYTYEKVITNYPCYRMQILRKRIGQIKVEADHVEKTITINNKLFRTEYLHGYTYKKLKGNMIGVSSFSDFIKFLKEGQMPKELWNSRIQGFLLKLTKNQFTTIN